MEYWVTGSMERGGYDRGPDPTMMAVDEVGKTWFNACMPTVQGVRERMESLGWMSSALVDACESTLTHRCTLDALQRSKGERSTHSLRWRLRAECCRAYLPWSQMRFASTLEPGIGTMINSTRSMVSHVLENPEGSEGC